MRLHIGDLGPMPGVQAFECLSQVGIDRNYEYDSDEQIVTLGNFEFSGNVEILDNERTLFYNALLGKKAADTDLSDITLSNFQGAPIMLNVWDKPKKKFSKSYLVINPTWTQMPYPTTVNGVVTIRFEFQAVNGVKFPQHACGFTVASVGGSPTKTIGAFTGSRTAVQLSRAFQNSYAITAVNRVTDSGSALHEYTWNPLCVDTTNTTINSLVLLDTPAANSDVVVYYAYTSTNEAGGYICQTS